MMLVDVTYSMGHRGVQLHNKASSAQDKVGEAHLSGWVVFCEYLLNP